MFWADTKKSYSLLKNNFELDFAQKLFQPFFHNSRQVRRWEKFFFGG